jgi:transposase InsO family protein
MVYEFMKENKTQYTIEKMAELFGISRSAYYRWRNNGSIVLQDTKDDDLIDLIRKIVIKHKRRYGSPRVRTVLRKEYGKCVSQKKVARLMRENKLNVRAKRKWVKTTDSKHGLPLCDNILNREFKAQQKGQKWVSDITYLRSTDGWVYLTTVMDLFDRKIIGWALSDNMETFSTTVPALEMAFGNRAAQQGLIFHSDRGVQYCAQNFRDILKTLCPTITQSMSRKGNCWDNACAESFFRTLKVELDTLDGRYSAIEVRQSVFLYIEAYYNRQRLHSAIDYRTPDNFILNTETRRAA